MTSEQKEALRFADELDGKAAPSGDFEAELRVAAIARASDLSGDSAVKHELKAVLLGRSKPRARDAARWMPRPRLALGALATALLAPLAVWKYLAPPPQEVFRMQADLSMPTGAAISNQSHQGTGSKNTGVKFGNKTAFRRAIASGSKQSAADSLQRSGESLAFTAGVLGGGGLAMSGGVVAGFEAPQPQDREGYRHIEGNRFTSVTQEPLSTFSIDVDRASYANVRRLLSEGRMPPAGAVRIEEMINYFDYDYPDPSGPHPFSISAESADCPWAPSHKLVHIGIQGKRLETGKMPPSNLVFLIDTSGSMREEIELVKRALSLLADTLRDEDTLSIVAYAGSAGLVLPPTPGSDKKAVLGALDALQSGGSTAGGAGIQLAYDVAQKNFKKGGNNRVLLATDGDFNVGVSSDDELVRLIEDKRKSGVFLTVLGFGRGNYQDAKMEQLANKGNGNYAYIDGILEAQKVLVREMGGTLLTIAKDVKIQVEYNPAKVEAYRLIGYETRMLAAQDFNDDKKDAGELGAGHTVTALYEIVPKGADVDLPKVDDLKYQKTGGPADAFGDELLTVKFRYKDPAGAKSKLIAAPLKDETVAWNDAPENLRFSAAVAGFGMLLRGAEDKGDLSYKAVRDWAASARGADKHGDRAEFLRLVAAAEALDRR